MGLIHEDKTYALKIRESATDGSDFSSPEADYRMLFLGEDGFLHAKDSAGSVTDPYDASGSGGLVGYDIERETGGDITINDTVDGSFTDVNAVVGDLVVAASTGDLLKIGLSSFSSSPGAVSLRIDVKFITGATENFVSSLGTTPAANGISQWFCHASTNVSISGEIAYVVQAADISGGNVTLRLCGWVSSSSRALGASTSNPLVFSVTNLGQ